MRINSKLTSAIQATAYYNGEFVTVLDTHGINALIVTNNNPIETEWVFISNLDRITWIVDTDMAC